MTEKVKDLFAAQREIVAKAVAGGVIDTDVPIVSMSGEWRRVLTAIYRAVIEDFGNQVAEELSPRTRAEGVEFDPWNSLIQDHVATKTAEQVTLIQETTKKAIREVVLNGIDDGLSLVKVARAIREKFEEWEGASPGVYRSAMIARTEVHAAAGFAMHESARQSGVVNEKHWLDAGDDRVRDAHVTNTAAGWIAFDDVYPNGASYPGDGTDDINCRCVEMYRTR